MRLTLFWLIAGLCALCMGVFGGDPLKLIAFPVAVVCFLALPWPWRKWAHAYPWLRELVGPAILLTLCGALYAPLLAGHLPVNHDHPVLFLQAWVTGTQFAPSGRLTGFSETMFAGYPANSLYPIGTSLLVLAVKALSLGRASWETAYAWAFFLAVLAYPAALYALGRRALGPLAGLVAGLLGVVDRGGFGQSGWEFNVFWGVWSMGLSFAFCLWSLWAVDRLAIRPGRFTLVGTAAAVAAALVCHPMAVALLAVSIPLYLLVLVLTGRLSAPVSWLPRVAGGVTLGIGLAAWWLLPFISHLDYFKPLAGLWRSYKDVIQGLFNGFLLVPLSPVFMIGGFIGLMLAARRRNDQAWFWLILAGLLLFFSTDEGLLAFGLLKRLPSLSNLQMKRFSYLIRTAALLGFGFLVEAVARGVEIQSTDAAEPGYRKHLRRLLAAAIAAPLFVFGIYAIPSYFFVSAPLLTYERESPRYANLRAAADYLKTRDKTSLGRIALVADTNDHFMMLFPVYTDLPIFKVGFTPEDNYRYKFESRDPAVWKALNISHALSVKPLAMAGLELEKTFGELSLYRFLSYSRERCSLTGPGQVEALRDEPEAMDIRIRGVKPGAQLCIHKSRFALWRAEMDGAETPIRGCSVGDSPPVFMQVRVRDGLLKLRYGPGAAEWTGAVLSWLSLAMELALVLLRLPFAYRGWRRFLPSPPAILSKVVTVTVLGGVTLGLIGLALRLILPPPSPFPGRAIVTDLAARLSRARGEIGGPAGNLSCKPFAGGKISCPSSPSDHAGEVILVASDLMRQCILPSTISGVSFTLCFDQVPLGEALQGHLAMDDDAFRSASVLKGKFSVFLDGVPLGSFDAPVRRGWYGWEVPTRGRTGTRGRIAIQTESAARGGRHPCFTAYATRPADKR